MSEVQANEIIISVQNYYKKFRKFNIENINFAVLKGKIHALVGKSGSGKSVILKSIIGAIPATNYKGTVTINKFNAGTAASKLSLGYSLNLENFPLGISAYKFLKYLGETTTISKNQLNENLEILLKYFNLWEQRNKLLNSFSSGMKNRVMLIAALVNNPDLVILDEPGANLDSESRKYFYSILKTLKNQGKTILLTTHIIHEVQDIIDDCTIIENGEMLYTGPISKFEVGKIFVLNTSNNQLAIQVLKQNHFNVTYQENNDNIIVKLINQEKRIILNQLLVYNQIIIYDLYENELDLTYLKSVLGLLHN